VPALWTRFLQLQLPSGGRLGWLHVGSSHTAEAENVTLRLVCAATGADRGLQEWSTYDSLQFGWYYTGTTLVL